MTYRYIIFILLIQVQQMLSFLNVSEINIKGIEEPIASAIAKGLCCIVNSDAVDTLIEQVN